ncbi:TPA: class I SAM-dependent methyltransferase [Aeromonas veronii]
MSLDYYNQHAHAFAESTLGVDMQPLYRHFLPLIPPGGHIVDAGCGSGRDSHAFKAAGFQVSAFDGSEQLAALASQYIGQPVAVCRFEQFQADQPVDGIWACASLLHVPAANLLAVMAHLARQLKAGGHFYCSFKYGCGELTRDGRVFTQLDETALAALLRELPLTAVDVWQTADLRPGRADERWLNAVLLARPS